jgi:hypothetical protein
VDVDHLSAGHGSLLRSGGTHGRRSGVDRSGHARAASSGDDHGSPGDLPVVQIAVRLHGVVERVGGVVHPQVAAGGELQQLDELGARPPVGGRQEQVGIEVKYEGYIAKQQQQVERMRRLESKTIPANFDYEAITGLRTEARHKLKQFQPATVGQAGRIAGVNPADISILLIHLEKRTKATAN